MAIAPLSSLADCFENAKQHVLRQCDLYDNPGLVDKIREFCPKIIFASVLSTSITALITGIAAYKGRINWLRWLPLPPITIGLVSWALAKFGPPTPEYSTIMAVAPDLQNLKIDSRLQTYAKDHLGSLTRFVKRNTANQADLEAAARLGLICDIFTCMFIVRQNRPKSIDPIWIGSANLPEDLKKKVQNLYDFLGTPLSEQVARLKPWNLPNVIALDQFMQELVKSSPKL